MDTNRARTAGLIVAAASLACGLAAAADAPKPNPDREAYFGETHIHTSWSVDAWAIGNRMTGPDDAYKYAQGETIKHPLGYDIRIDTPGYANYEYTVQGPADLVDLGKAAANIPKDQASELHAKE